MPRKGQHRGTRITKAKRNPIARAGARRAAAGPMKDKRRLSRQEQAIRDRKNFDI